MKEIKRNTFTNGFCAALKLDDGFKIETVATCLPISTELRGMPENKTSNKIVDYNEYDPKFWKEKFMVGVSVQSGCPLKCKFCCVNVLTEKQGFRNLTDVEIVDQVKWAISEAGHKPEDAQLFRVLFTRMGDSSLNIENVVGAARALKNLYPNVRIQISTIGIKKKTEDLVRRLANLQVEFGEQFIELQFSIHSTKDTFRKWLQHPSVMSNESLGNLSNLYNAVLASYGIDVRWKVTLNFALATDTPFDVKELAKQFDSDDVFVKVSPINENIVSESNNLHTLVINTNNL